MSEFTRRCCQRQPKMLPVRLPWNLRHHSGISLAGVGQGLLSMLRPPISPPTLPLLPVGILPSGPADLPTSGTTGCTL